MTLENPSWVHGFVNFDRKELNKKSAGVDNLQDDRLVQCKIQ